MSFMSKWLVRFRNTCVSMLIVKFRRGTIAAVEINAIVTSLTALNIFK